MQVRVNGIRRPRKFRMMKKWLKNHNAWNLHLKLCESRREYERRNNQGV